MQGFSKEFQTILNRLKNNDPTLKIFHLENKKLTDKHFIALGQCLVNAQSLNTLYLDRNKISKKGARALAEGLAKNQSLLMLSIAYCKIGYYGIKELAKALKENDSLEELLINNINITVSGVKCLMEGLAQNRSLKMLQIERDGSPIALTNKKLAKNLAKVLESYLLQNQSLQKLGFGYILGDIGCFNDFGKIDYYNNRLKDLYEDFAVPLQKIIKKNNITAWQQSKAGNPFSQASIGYCLRHNIALQRDSHKSDYNSKTTVDWYKESAMQNNLQARLVLKQLAHQKNIDVANPNREKQSLNFNGNSPINNNSDDYQPKYIIS